MLAIIGASGHAKCAYECFYLNGQDVYGFFDDAKEKKNLNIINNIRCLGVINDIEKHSSISMLFIAIGDNRLRLELYKKYREKGYQFPNAIHQKAYISNFSILGEANFIMANGVVNPHSKIDNCCIINTAATVGHDCQLEDGVQIASGVNVAGSCSIRQGTFVGIGAKICPEVDIGAWAIIGAGAIVLNSLEGGAFYCGTPAKKAGPAKFK